MSSEFKLSSRPSDFQSVPAALRLGGVTIYGPSQLELARAVKAVADAIDQCSKQHLSLTRVTLNSEVRSLLSVAVERRIFGVILGSQLRLGIVDSIPCAAVSGSVFRVYVHHQQGDAFQEHLETTVDELRRRGVVQVRDIEDKLFGNRRWGTWSSASHILARLVQIGRACYVDEKSFRWPLEPGPHTRLLRSEVGEFEVPMRAGFSGPIPTPAIRLVKRKRD